MVEALLTAWRQGKRVLLMGNGGSSSSVSHIVNDMQKNIALEAGKPLRTLCLTDCAPLMMAWANDTEWDNIFEPQVRCWTEPRERRSETAEASPGDRFVLSREASLAFRRMIAPARPNPPVLTRKTGRRVESMRHRFSNRKGDENECTR